MVFAAFDSSWVAFMQKAISISLLCMEDNNT